MYDGIHTAVLVLSTKSDYQLIAQLTLADCDCCWLLHRQLHLKFADYCVSFLRLLTDIFQPTNTELRLIKIYIIGA